MTSADAKQLELLRRASPSERCGLALRLSDQLIALSRRAIDRNWPELGPEERKLKYVELQYGADLARRLGAWLAARRQR